ncbi:chorismate mutase [Candidatus Parcubacteria bacterium]|jgi:monofunctional chorismate mutase|nr:chorismate mutase [Candidatus Parcubacteria bacterium]MBT3949100.1 chorismate mutase [Candidatus Parcubacteria bacterium]
MNNLQDFRKEINNIDRSILELLQKRFEVAKEIGLLKMDSNVEDNDREQELFAMYKSIGNELGLDKEFVRVIFQKIIDESKNIQRKI